MRRPAVFTCFSCLAVAVLSGCASGRVMTEGERREFVFTATPHALAVCAAGNARSFNAHFTATVNELTRPDNFQIVVTKTSDDFRAPLLIGRTWPSPEGSHLEVFLSADLGPVARDDWTERLRRGC